MSRRSRKRKLESDEETDTKWELTNILNADLREEMATMWEIPQIFHFLHMSKNVLNVSHLSMYEVERMLAMPRASKQLATIMTALLSHPLPRSKMKKVPTMPYEFWVNVLTHKVKGWFKVYWSKHRDIVKVLEAIGVEPEFWRIFPDDSIIDEKEFDQLSFKQRVWILKTLCDTLMHSRKTIQDEISKQLAEDSYEIVLGADRYGAKFIYFPLFLDNDVRVYRHCIDNTILSTVKAPPRREGQQSGYRPEKSPRTKRKRPRWKNGSLPRDRRRPKRSHDDETKTSDSAIGSSMNEDTNFSGTSSCSNNNNNNVIGETIERNRSRSPSKMSEMSSTVSGDTRSSNAKSTSGYDTTTSDGKSCNENEEMFRGFDNEVVNDTDAIDGIHDILNRLRTKVDAHMSDDSTEMPCAQMVNSEKRNENDDEDEDEEDDEDKELDDEFESRDTREEKFFDTEQRSDSRTDSTCDDHTWTNCGPQKNARSDSETIEKEASIFVAMLNDLSFSIFELAADSVGSLRDLATSLRTPGFGESRRTAPVPNCELNLARAIENLAGSLEDVEAALEESTRRARTKLRREFTNFRDGVIEDEDASGEVEGGSNGWLLGSQGIPMLSSSETALQALSNTAVSRASAENSAESQGDVDARGGGNSNEDVNEDDKVERGSRDPSQKLDSDKNDDDDDNDEDDSEPDQPRRVLRARGVSSYTEQLSSDEEEAYQLEEWSRLETVDPTPGTSNGPSDSGSNAKNEQANDQNEEKNPDHDWILPGARKRKRKRSPASRKLKSLHQKMTSVTSPSGDTVSSAAPPTPEERCGSKAPEARTASSSLICKMESVHSELDIKDEDPIYECNRTIGNPQMPPTSNHATHAGPQRGTGEPRQTRALGVSREGGTLGSVPPGYYVQQAYYDPRYVRYPYAARPGMTYTYPPPPGYPGRPQYWQPPNYPPLPSYRPPYGGQRALAPPGRHQATASTTLYGARMPAQLLPSRVSGPRTISVQNLALRFPTRPRLPLNQPPPPRRQVPRPYTTVQPSPSSASVTSARPTRPNRPSPRGPAPTKPVEKSTSLILLSDSDDEIEMIVPEKQSTVLPPQNHRVSSGNRTRRVDTKQAKPPIVTQTLPTKTSEVLSPEIIQRMSQGGISITPVKPPASKQQIGEANAQSTKLVVVVNETGSHYALALPNGSKLILTPEQVAQIRASNGGKLVL